MPMKTNSSLLVVARAGPYYSHNDERAFFEWLERIDGFQSVKGVGRELHIQIREDISEDGLVDLAALFFRYKADLTQIPRMFSVDRYPRLLNKKAFWFSAMFPDGV